MHIILPINKETALKGKDSGEEQADRFKQGNNFSISTSGDSKKNADRLFNELSEDGQVIMPMDNTFWDSYF